MSGLQLKKRGGTWHATGTIGGQRIRKSLGTGDKGQAEELRAQYEARLWKRHTYGEEAVRTFEEAAVSYLQQGGEGRFLPPILKHFKGRAVASIKPADVRQIAVELFDNPATRNRQVITPARSVINHAHDRGWCGPIRVKLFPVPKSRMHKPVDRVWMDSLLDQCDLDNLPHLAAAVLFMHQTGARASEAANLMGEHVDLSNAVVVLAKTKTDEWHPRYLTTELVARIAALDIEDGKRVFRYSHPTSINHRMKKVCKRAKIEYRSPHSAGRHSFATNAMRLGVGIKDAMDAGGWKSAALFMETYVHSDDSGRRVVSALEGTKLARVVTKKEKPKKKQSLTKGG